MPGKGFLDPASAPERRLTPAPSGAATPVESLVFSEDISARAACFSSDANCANPETFGIIDVKLKGNIPLIRWERTGAGDKSWDIDVDLGGFRIAQITDGRAPFLIADAAPTNSLRVDGFGRVGLGTSLPSENLHIVDSSDSSLRLQVGGQAWDIFTGSGSTALRVFNATGGGIPLVIDPGGNVGVGPSLPVQSFHVRRSNGTAQLLVEEASTIAAPRTLAHLKNKGPVALRFENTEAGIVSELRANASGLEVSGDFAVLSSRAAKDVVGSVEPEQVLSRLLNLPIDLWVYKADASGRTHIGPMAEDWANAFAFGSASESLSLVDATGVTIAAIQGLYAELRDRDQSILELENANRNLELQVKQLGDLVGSLAQTVEGLRGHP